MIDTEEPWDYEKSGKGVEGEPRDSRLVPARVNATSALRFGVEVMSACKAAKAHHNPARETNYTKASQSPIAINSHKGVKKEPTHCNNPLTRPGKPSTTTSGSGNVTIITGKKTPLIATKNSIFTPARTLTLHVSAFCTTFPKQNRKASSQRIHSRSAASMMLPMMET